jgi:septum formation protein
MQRQIILASTSPRRRELLTHAGISFIVESADVDERVLAGETPEEHTARLALEKARVVARRRGKGIVLAADTVVVIDRKILGKPADRQDALRMLTLLSGRKHRVVTAVAVLDAGKGRMATRHSKTGVWFRKLSRREIDAYVATGEPLDKAGAYGIQERGGLLVERIDGCYFNVVGLPISLVGAMLAEFGIETL